MWRRSIKLVWRTAHIQSWLLATIFHLNRSVETFTSCSEVDLSFLEVHHWNCPFLIFGKRNQLALVNIFQNWKTFLYRTAVRCCVFRLRIASFTIIFVSAWNMILTILDKVFESLRCCDLGIKRCKLRKWQLICSLISLHFRCLLHVSKRE